MTITSIPDHKNRILNTVCSGFITRHELEHYQHTAWLDPAIYGYNELFDLTESDFSDVSFSDLLTVAKNASKLSIHDPNSRFAFLTATPHHEELAKFYITARSMIDSPSRDLKQFSSQTKALEWLLEQ